MRMRFTKYQIGQGSNSPYLTLNIGSLPILLLTSPHPTRFPDTEEKKHSELIVIARNHFRYRSLILSYFFIRDRLHMKRIGVDISKVLLQKSTTSSATGPVTHRAVDGTMPGESPHPHLTKMNHMRK